MNILDWAATATLKTIDRDLSRRPFADLNMFDDHTVVNIDEDSTARLIDECGFDTWIIHADGGWIAYATQVHDNMETGNFWVHVGRDDCWFKTLTEAQTFLWENHSKHEAGA